MTIIQRYFNTFIGTKTVVPRLTKLAYLEFMIWS
jgi:hypothetical protein